jgi:hypothetical protein
LPSTKASRTGRRGELDLGPQRQQRRHAVGGRRGVAQIARHGAGVLDLHRADLARRRLQPVEGRRQVGADDVGPARARTDRPAAVVAGDTAQRVEPANVEDVVADRPRALRRVEIGAAGQHAPASVGEQGERLVDCGRSGMALHRQAG